MSWMLFGLGLLAEEHKCKREQPETYAEDVLSIAISFSVKGLFICCGVKQ